MHGSVLRAGASRLRVSTSHLLRVLRPPQATATQLTAHMSTLLASLSRTRRYQRRRPGEASDAAAARDVTHAASRVRER